MDPEKRAGGRLPRRTTSMAVAATIEDPDRHTKKRRPWRIRSVPFSAYLMQDYRGEGTPEKPFVVTWLPDDPANPQTFGNAYKWTVTMLVAVITLAVALASSAYSGAIESIEEDFAPSTIVATLGVSLFVLGFALGPLGWAPISEIYGRRPVLLVSYAMFTLWNGVACASPNMASLIVFRFLAGAFGSSPLTNSGGTISDMFSAKQRGLAVAIFAAAPFLGPSLGPISGGFLGISGGWRWVQGFLALFSGVLTVAAFLFVPETYAPALLRDRAKHLSTVTGKNYRAVMDAQKPLVIKQLFKTSLSRPWVLLFQEPIVIIISLYMAIVYGTLYMLFSAFPIVYQQGRGWNAGVGGLAFLGVLVGMLLGVSYTIFYDNPRYIKAVDRHGGKAPAEARLPPSMLGAVMLVIGLAWFAASDGPSVHWIVSIMAGAPFGFGMLLVFLSMMNYLIDCYTVYAASVLASNSVLRSLFGAAFPLFTPALFHNLGIHWGAAVPGFLALACLPFPFVFYKYGAAVRSKCKYTRKADELMAQMSGGGAEKETAATKEGAQPSDAEITRENAMHEVDDFPPPESTAPDRSNSETTLADISREHRGKKAAPSA